MCCHSITTRAAPPAWAPSGPTFSSLGASVSSHHSPTFCFLTLTHSSIRGAEGPLSNNRSARPFAFLFLLLLLWLLFDTPPHTHTTHSGGRWFTSPFVCTQKANRELRDGLLPRGCYSLSSLSLLSPRASRKIFPVHRLTTDRVGDFCSLTIFRAISLLTRSLTRARHRKQYFSVREHESTRTTQLRGF